MGNTQLGFWARSPDADGDYTPEFTMYPRWSRLGVDWNGGGLGGDVATLGAKIEIDFHGGGSESRAVPRMRHAYGTVQIGDVTFLGGQTWDLFAPLIAGGMENAILWYGGNLGDRRPQLRVTYAPDLGPVGLVMAAAAAQSGAVDMEDVDGDGVMDGNAWAKPAAQGLVELRIRAFGEKPLRVGASGHYGGKTIQVAGEEETFDVFAAVGHVEVPVSILTVRAEVWAGENVNDLRGGIGQGIAITRNVQNAEAIDDAEAIEARGGWAHVNLVPVDWYSVTLGIGLDNPREVGSGARTKNTTFNFANVFKPWQPVSLGLTLDRYHTKYQGGDTAKVNRITASTMVSF